MRIQDSLEIAVIFRDHAAQQITLAGDGIDFEHLRDGREVIAGRSHHRLSDV